MRKSLALLVVAVGLIGCANPINQRTATDYYQWGGDAELAGNWQLAERNYERALINARLGHSPDAGISAAMYGLGKSKGHLCKYSDAEKLLQESLQLEEKVTGPESGITTMRLFELARLHYDQGQYAASLSYYSRGLAAVKKLGVATSDPIALAGALDEYASALEKTQRDAEASSIRQEAQELRQRHPGAKARFVPVRYTQRCIA